MFRKVQEKLLGKAPPAPAESWELYITRQDGEALTSVLVNTGVMEALDAASGMVSVLAEVALGAPREDGLPTQEQGEALLRLDQDLEQLAAQQGCWSLGRATWAGKCRMNYLVPKARVKAVLAGIEQVAQGHGYALRHTQEPEGARGFYRDVLYPDAQDRRQIADEKILARLQEQGDLGNEPRQVMHWAYFPDHGAAQGFSDWAFEQGYVIFEAGIAEGKDGLPHQVRFTNVCMMAHGQIMEHSRNLVLAAEKFGGDYDGWETEVVTTPRG